LPPCLRGEGDAPDDEIAVALGTTGFFLENRLAPALGNKPLPVARARFFETFTRRL
jgi:DNA repair protein RecO (recombination protein O)